MRPMAATGARLRADGGQPHVAQERADPPSADARKGAAQQAAQHPRPREGNVQVQHIDLPHQGEIARRHWPWRVRHRAPAGPARRRLPRHGKRVRPLDHRLELSRPALQSVRSKTSSSNASSPILAWRVFTSSGGTTGPPPTRRPHRAAVGPSTRGSGRDGHRGVRPVRRACLHGRPRPARPSP